MDITSYLLGKKAGGGGSQGLKVVVVDELPATGSTDILYLVPKTTSKTNNIFDEYLYTEDGWELIGSTDIDLSNYVDMTSAQTISGKKTFTTLPESSVAPTTNNQLSNKKYVDDGLSGKQGTIDSSHKLNADLVDDTNSTNKFFSGNYNDLTNKPTIPDDSELLHYKGHVNSEGDLPSLGQASGSLVSPALSVTDVDAFSEKWLNPFKCSQDRINALLNDATMSAKRTGYTYYILGATCTTQDGSTIKGRRLVIAYNDPSQVEIQMLYSNYSWNGMYLFSINASQANPVYVYTTPETEYQSYSDKLRHWTSSSDDDSVLDTAITSPMVLQGGYTYVDGRKRCIYFSNQIKYSGNVADVLDLTINDLTGLDSYFKAGAYKSIQFTDDNYIWNDDMVFLLPTTANTVNVQENTTTTKLNDTYTVGSNYDIYRRNESKQWDKFSKSPDVVTTISSASTNSDVPGALAVYNYVNSLNGNGVSY